MEALESISKILIALIPNVGILSGAIVIFFFFKWYFEYKKFLITTNAYQPFRIKDFRILILLIGILSIASGIPLTLIFLYVYGISIPLLGGVIPLFVGIGLLIFYILTLKNKTE
ncbi:MAG: hypothetical protein ACK4UJ_07615 [Leptonema sp. (in: bacteria)]